MNTHLWNPTTTWLNTAQHGLPPTTAHTALTQALHQWHTGTTPIHHWNQTTEHTRTLFAQLINAPTTDITLGATTSQIIGTIAASLPDHTNVLLPQEEFTSTTFPFHTHHDRGITITTAPLHSLADHIGPHTHLVAYSPVQSATGTLAPTEQILTAAREHDTLVIADATQAAGWHPLNATHFDALVCSAYKWLMAPRGLALAYIAPTLRERLRPINAGPSADRHPAHAFYAPHPDTSPHARGLDLSPNWFATLAAAPALQTLLDTGIDKIHTHNTHLADRFRAHLDQPPAHSAITTVTTPGALQTLREAGIIATERGGHTRLAFHLYNTEADADLAAHTLTR
ncbi:aminotransferase class V-fold PLP-dependent enzyme [Nocardiopsis alba]|uniref:Aminotransferase class V-fold PLP-dependent enzyme n=1 Tax=Nocardiopsis alba TaxID=53437 RepID=A0ABV5DQ49_9ACTN|nr:aminotransferase class V-fold PLP-dependent enzyme [Nocardiopsis alba]